MSGQKPLHFLKSTRYWSMIQQFLDDPSKETLSLPRYVTAADRDYVRQICKHFDVPFKVHGEGTEKYMVLRKPDFSYFDEAEKEVAKQYINSAEVEKYRNLVIKLSSELNQQRMMVDLILHQAISSVDDRESMKEDTQKTVFKKHSYCGVCTERKLTKLSVECGHSFCDECWDISACSLCDTKVGDVIDLTEIKKEISESSPKRFRS